MASVNAVIRVNIDASAANAGLQQMAAQMSRFNKGMVQGSASMAAAQVAAANRAQGALNRTGQWMASTGSVMTAAGRMHKQFDKGTMASWQQWRDTSKKNNLVNQMAAQRVRALQTQYVALGREVDGAQRVMKAQPTGMLRQWGAEAEFAHQKAVLLNRRMTMGANSMINWGKNTQWAGRQMMVGMGIPLGIAAMGAVKSYKEMETAAISFKRVYGDATTSAGEKAKMLGVIQNGVGQEMTKYGIAVADTVGIAAKAAATGQQGDKLVTATRETMRLATLGQMDYDTALQSTIATQTAFGVSQKGMVRTTDFLNAAENQTVLSMEDMAKAIPRVAPVIKGLGGDVEDLAVLMTALRAGGVTAEQGANALKSGLGSLINPTSGATEAMEKFGIPLDKIVKTNKGDLIGTVQDFGKALHELPKFEQQQALEALFGKYQYARMGALFNNINKDQARETARLSKDSSANLAKISEQEMSQISDSAMNKFQGAIERLKAAAAPLGESILGGLAPLVDGLSNVIGFFANNDAARNVALFAGAFAGLAGVGVMLTGVFANFFGTMMKGYMGLKNIGRRMMGRPSLAYSGLDELEASAAQRQLAAAAEGATASLYGEKGAVNQLTAALNAMNAELRESVGLQAASAGGPPVGGGGRTRRTAAATAATEADRQPISQFRSSIAAGADRAHISRPISLLAPENAAALKKIQAAYGPESSVGKAIAAAQASGATIAGKNGRFLAMDTILNNEMDRVGSPGVKGIELANDATTKGGDVYKPFLRQLAYGAGVSASDMVRDPAVQRAVEGFHREYVSTFAGMGENYIKGEGFQSVVEPMMRKHFGSLPGWDATGLVHQISGEGFGKLEVPNSDSAITGWKSESLKKVSESIDMSGYKLSQATDGQIDAVTRSATETEKQATQTSKENTKAQKNLTAAQKAHSAASAKVIEQEKKLATSSGLLARTKDKERRSARKIEIDGINRDLERAKSAEAVASRNLTKATDAVAAENRTRALALKDGTKASGIAAKSGESVPLRSTAGIAPVPTSQSEESKAAARRLKGLPPVVPASEQLTASQMRANSAMRQRFDQAEQNALSGKGLRAGRMGTALMGGGPTAARGGIWQSMRAGGAFTGDKANAWSNKLMGLGMAADMVTMGLMASGKEVPVWTHMVGMGMMTLAMFPDLLLKPASKLGAGMKTAGASLGARVLPALKSVGSKAKVLATGAAMLGTELLGMGKKGQIGAGLKTFAKGFGIVGGAVTALAAVAFFAERQWKASLNSAIEGGNALGAAMSTDATEIQALGQQYGNEKTLAQKYADRRAVTSFSASKAQEEAGKAVSQSGIGQAIMTDVAKVVNEQGLSRGIESLGVKLATATLQGAMSQGDVKGFASALAESNPALASGAMKEYGSLVSQSSLKTDPVGTALKINEANNRMVNSTLDSMMQEQVRTQQQIDEARATNDNGGLSENTNARIGRLGTNANEITQLEMQSKLQEAKYAGLAGTVMGAGLGQQVDNRAAAYMRLLDIKKQLNATDDPRQQATLAQQWDNGTAALQKFDSQQKETLQNAQDAFNSIQGDDARNAMQGSLDNAVRQRYAGDIMAGAIAEGNIQQLWDQGNAGVITREIQFKLTALQASGAINPDALNKMLSTEGGSAKVDLVMGNTSSLNEAGDFFNKISSFKPGTFKDAVQGIGDGFIKAAKYAGMTQKEAIGLSKALGGSQADINAIKKAFQGDGVKGNPGKSRDNGNKDGKAYKDGAKNSSKGAKGDGVKGNPGKSKGEGNKDGKSYKDGANKSSKGAKGDGVKGNPGKSSGAGGKDGDAYTKAMMSKIKQISGVSVEPKVKVSTAGIGASIGAVASKAQNVKINYVPGDMPPPPDAVDQPINRVVAMDMSIIPPLPMTQMIMRFISFDMSTIPPFPMTQMIMRFVGFDASVIPPPPVTQLVIRKTVGGSVVGGPVGGFADGGDPFKRRSSKISGRGGPKDDLIPTMLSNGEFVIRASSVNKYGTGFMNKVNRGQIDRDVIPHLSTGDEAEDSKKKSKSKKNSKGNGSGSDNGDSKDKDTGWKDWTKEVKKLSKAWDKSSRLVAKSKPGNYALLASLFGTGSPNAIGKFKPGSNMSKKFAKQQKMESLQSSFNTLAEQQKLIKASKSRVKLLKKNWGLRDQINTLEAEELITAKNAPNPKKMIKRMAESKAKAAKAMQSQEYQSFADEQKAASDLNDLRIKLSQGRSDEEASAIMEMSDEELRQYGTFMKKTKGNKKDPKANFIAKRLAAAKRQTDFENKAAYMERSQSLAKETAFSNRVSDPNFTALSASAAANLSQEDYEIMQTLSGTELINFQKALNDSAAAANSNSRALELLSKKAEYAAMTLGQQFQEGTELLNQKSQAMRDEQAAIGEQKIVEATGKTRNQLEAEIGTRGVEVSRFQHQQELEQRHMDDINEKYNEQAKLLDDISQSQQIISSLQRGRLSVASALSSGDIAAAAAAAQEQRASEAQASIDMMKSALEKERDDRLKEHQDRIDEAQDSIDTLNDQIFEYQHAMDSIAATYALIGADTSVNIDKLNTSLQAQSGYWAAVTEDIDEYINALKEVNPNVLKLPEPSQTTPTTPSAPGGDNNNNNNNNNNNTTPPPLTPKQTKAVKIADRVEKKAMKAMDKAQDAKKAAKKTKTKKDDRQAKKATNKAEKIEGLADKADKVALTGNVDKVKKLNKNAGQKLENVNKKVDSVNVVAAKANSKDANKKVDSLQDKLKAAKEEDDKKKSKALAEKLQKAKDDAEKAENAKQQAQAAAKKKADDDEKARQKKKKDDEDNRKKQSQEAEKQRKKKEEDNKKAQAQNKNKKNNGGFITKKYASGGFVGGIGNTDKVPALLTPGEFVMTKGSAARYGKALERVNSPSYKFASNAAGYSGGSAMGTSIYNLTVNAQTNADANDIATITIKRIQDMERTRIRERKV